nr:DNRLRE domain-containing protein [uncultured Flavobacterium sp.]
MKYKVFTVAISSLLLFSCSKKEDENTSENSLKVFTVKEGDSYMLHESYPEEPLKWDYISTTYNIVDGKIFQSNVLLNFETGNFLNKVQIDSAFLVLKPFPDQNFGENAIEINLLKSKFLNNYTWNNKPVLIEDYFAKSSKIDKDDKYKIDVTNLIKFQAANYGFNTPFSMSLFNEAPTESTFAGFFSLTKDLKESAPKLEIYYKNK